MFAAASSFLAGLLAELLRNVVTDWRRDAALKAAGAAEAANIALGKALAATEEARRAEAAAEAEHSASLSDDAFDTSFMRTTR